jgi:hypothetical protein
MKLQKQNLEMIYKFLDQLAFKGASSRPVTKLKHAIQATLAELRDDEIALVEENDGTINDQGTVTFPDGKAKLAFTTAQQELRQEEALFDETTQGQFKRLKQSLEDYDGELSGQHADAYDALLDALEEQ